MAEKSDSSYKKCTLSNGLEVIIVEDKSLPIVSVNIWYKVGSANEKLGKTGFAHLFEHMMFQGSENIEKEQHFKFIQEAGGSLNGSTSLDRTNYYETLPSNNLELALWLESDRMGYLLPALTEEKLRNQKDVVLNERRQRYDNQPYGLAWEKMFAAMFPQNHPYHWPTIGWTEDIENFELNDVKEFFRTYYAPSNASMVIIGDLQTEKTLKLVEKYFNDIPSSGEIPLIHYARPTLKENKTIEFEDNIQLPRLYLGWHSDHLYGKKDAAMDIISEVLTSSKNSRLYKTLVHEKQIAHDISAFNYSAKLNGMFFIIATAKEDVDIETIKKALFEELNKIKNIEIDTEELEKAKNNIKSTYIYSLQKQTVLADQINNYNCNLGEPDSFKFDLDRYASLTRAQIKETADYYFSQPYVELRILNKK